MALSEMPTVETEAGLIIANFSSPHPFNFDDGTVLAGCESDRVTELMLQTEEVVIVKTERMELINLNFIMSDAVLDALSVALAQDVDIVLVPFPVLDAWKKNYGVSPAVNVRAVVATMRMSSRETKRAYADKFCI